MLTSERPMMMRMRVSSSVPSPFIAALRRRAKYSWGFLAHLTIKSHTVIVDGHKKELKADLKLNQLKLLLTEGNVAVLECSCGFRVKSVQNV